MDEKSKTLQEWVKNYETQQERMGQADNSTHQIGIGGYYGQRQFGGHGNCPTCGRCRRCSGGHPYYPYYFTSGTLQTY